MVIFNIKLLAVIKEKRAFLDEFSRPDMEANIDKYVYPIGLMFDLPFYSALKKEDEIYLKENFTIMYENYYTAEEISLVIDYFTSAQFTNYNYSLNHWLTFTSNKDEIKFLVDELKYQYLLKQTIAGVPFNDEMNNLLLYLSSIEYDHNNFIMSAKK